MSIHKDKNNVQVSDCNPDNEGHSYQIAWANGSKIIDFQSGPVNDNGVNGVTNESLLAILIDRTKKINNKFPCRENALAITKMDEALMWFDKRTADRVARNVEGENKS